MVEAVHLELGLTERVVQPAPRLDCDPVARVLRHSLLAFERGALDLAPELPARIRGMAAPFVDEADILDERSAEGDVQNLDPAAHTEHGQALVECTLDELQLELVPLGVGRRELLVRLLSVPLRLDVAAAAEEDAVANLEHLIQVSVPDAGERQRQPACQGDRSLEADACVVREVEQSYGEADDRFLRARATHDSPRFLSQ